MDGRCNAFGEKNHLGEAFTETSGEFDIVYFWQIIMKKKSHNFSYSVILYKPTFFFSAWMGDRLVVLFLLIWDRISYELNAAK